MPTKLTSMPEWQALAAHAHQIRRTRIEALFQADPERFSRFALALEGMLLDTSKHLITEHTLGLLVDFARAGGLEEGIRRLFAGEIVNPTEGRAAMHMALRHLENTPVWVEGRHVMPDVGRVREKMRDFVEAVRSGAWRGYTGEPIEDIVNIGIGGDAHRCAHTARIGHWVRHRKRRACGGEP
ncbi:MAG: glucose-6-phosphate isomerase, partial [Zetaproteobacteria bacterium]